jgi:subtilisin family serine protease
MKLKPLALAITQLLSYPVFAQSFMGTPTPVFSANPNQWLNSTTINKANETIKANHAWSRGWTGKGSTILIMDTGIDVNHPDFAGKIKYQLDITRTGIQDMVGHGTHTAGIAAAAFDGVGITGVAFDANLAIAKLSNTSNVTSGQALQALNWARQYSDITVANFSANTSYSSAYTKSVTQVAPGIYASSDKNYGGVNYYNLEKPQSWAAAMSPNMVLTVSAGNSSNPYPQNPATFAAAVDQSGKLVLNGQMIIVGNWNTQAGRVEGAKAGHVCKNMVGTTCKDTFRTSDFYILAPGMSVVSDAIGGGVKSMSGTSQAAPQVAGAVAVIGQMWPYMTPANQVQLLLKTANKTMSMSWDKGF